MKEIFISYNKADIKWAEWLVEVLEEAGYHTNSQFLDFRPGQNFVIEMHRALLSAEIVIAVLSKQYLKSAFTEPEWAAAFRNDSQGQRRKLIPIRVEECHPEGLLGPIIYLDLVNLSEHDARAAVLGAFSDRKKRNQRTAFPGAISKIFPGGQQSSHFVDSIIDAGDEIKPELKQDRLIEYSFSDRVRLLQDLDQIAPEQLNMIIFALKPPQGLIPAIYAPKSDRIVALLNWAESPRGCGLGQVRTVLEALLGPH
jgi:hypothetical protein